MLNSDRKIIAFLEAEPAERARAAVVAFNDAAGRHDLPWTARHEPDTEATYRIGFDTSLSVDERWDVRPGPFMNLAIAGEVANLVSRIADGKVSAKPTPVVSKKPAPPKKLLAAKVGRETAGRRGKGVTTVFDLALSEADLKELATTLKEKCGTGGTAKDGRIEIQGDHRDRIVAELEKLGYKVKRAGG